MKFWENKKGLASALSIITLVVLSGGMGAGIWAFSQFDILSSEDGDILLEKKAAEISLSQLISQAGDLLGEKVVVSGTVTSPAKGYCYLENDDGQFPVGCWAPFTKPQPANANVALAETRTMDYYLGSNWKLLGEIVEVAGNYQLRVESYSAI